MTMDVGMYGEQQGCGEYYPPPCQYDCHEGYYDQQQYYEPALAAPLDTPPVISTDAGLCYTNLDYGELQHAYPAPPHAPHAPHTPHTPHAPHTPHMPLAHREEHKLDGHYLESKYNMHFVEEGVQYSAHAGSPLPCGDFDPYQPKEEFLGLREGFPRDAELHALAPHTHAQHAQHSQHAQHAAHAVPTYKWMQVKRNVPKPTGEYLF
ncbi:hypothetical protein RR46_01758 [Papilio xuthus]|uniref:Uncharacterized protein n=1 Tax=Papilio xuthus TaxID=66420 RepID=A0A194QG49_PAPXU|nr:hypothetical protein RR46_01758 [Papilio xuthus]